jgi:uncharacterized protein YbjQ (UPF0145 family)
MIVTTGNEVVGGKIVQYLGIVRGVVVRSPGIGRGFIGGIKALGGGNIQEFADVCDKARQDAFNLMPQSAQMQLLQCVTMQPNSANQLPKFWLTEQPSN